MIEIREQWIEKLKKIRNEEFVSISEQASDIGVNYVTYRKIIDPDIPPVSMSVMKKVKRYLDTKEE